MKAIFIAFLLLASMAFLPSSTLAAREIKGEKAARHAAVTAPTNNPNKPSVNCPPSSPYRECLKPRPPPAPKCSDYTRRCPP
ncbi:uncharacterized protein LOC130976542 [Arachis stenosperma]|uniref:uncharacterized protein LOC130976542 n=1 Tax=Arachis stenosperma TaxID=217475 RepID=UPI0025AB79DC|nr:uncharacterized protein LOC130976542 [Arachis stenosperma]